MSKRPGVVYEYDLDGNSNDGGPFSSHWTIYEDAKACEKDLRARGFKQKGPWRDGQRLWVAGSPEAGT